MKQDRPGSSQENRVSTQSKDEPIEFKEREPAGNKKWDNNLLGDF